MMKQKPKCRLLGTDGSVFVLAGRVRQALVQNEQPEKAKEFSEKLFKCQSYDEALVLMTEYVDVS